MRRRFSATFVACVAVIAGCGPARTAPLFPKEVPYLSRAEWGAKPPVLPMRRHEITRLTIHHTGVGQRPDQTLMQKLRGLQGFSQRDDSLANGRLKPAWADIPYHFYVGVDGTVGEARDWRYIGDSNTPYDPTGHLLVVIEGNFQSDTLTTAQRRTLDIIVPSLARRFGISAERLASHRDFAQTSCPGKNVYAELPRWRELIARQAERRPPGG